MAKIEQIAQTYLNKAAANPAQKHEICREAAYTFMGLAKHPKNVHASKQLTEVGLTFARAAGDSRPPVMDDFADLLKETADSYEAVGPWGDDTLDLHAHRRELHDARKIVSPGQVFITPETFNKDATLGRTAKLKWHPTDDDKRNGIEQSSTVAFWQGFKKEAQALTIDINITDQESPLNLPDDVPNIRISAVVTYGSDGNKTSAPLDLTRGRRFTVVGNYASVLISVEAPLDNQNDTSLVVEVGASIGVFAAPSLAPVTMTVYVPAEHAQQLAVNAVSGDFVIPIKAAMLLQLLCDGVGITSQVSFNGYDGETICVVPYQNSPGFLAPPVPIPAGAVSFSIRNGDVGAAAFQAIFQLSL